MYNPTKTFTKQEISDILDFNRYKTSKELIKRNTSILTNKLKLPTKTNDYIELYNALTNIFTIEEKHLIYRQNTISNTVKNIQER
jgi:hypothetical protein